MATESLHSSRRIVIGLIAATLVLATSACAQTAPTGEDLVRQRATSEAASESLVFSSRQIGPEEIPVESSDGVAFDWGVEIAAPGLADAEFTVFEWRQRELQLRSGDHIAFDPIFEDRADGSRKIVGVARLRTGPTLESVDGLPSESWSSQAARQVPTVEGFDYISSNRIVFRAASHKFVGLWRARGGGETLLVAFDDLGSDSSGRPTSTILARLQFEATVVSTTGGHHGGPTWILLMTDPDPMGRFRLINVLWANPAMSAR
jgi:hypothetical protein